ncbi:helix-turn-helix domain-containing protein, partial [Alcanivorax sp.]|uniref:helix-turn-helix domain-containing protein n=1 Tax=Alcanivorax sp. TaxID=1872427 RepID=UPI00338F7D3D
MNIRLHANATTTPRIRKALQQAPEHVSNRKLAEQFGISVATVRRWRYRDSIEDRSHTPHHLRTTLTPEQQQVVLALRRTL